MKEQPGVMQWLLIECLFIQACSQKVQSFCVIWEMFKGLRLNSESRSTRHINSITVTFCNRKWWSRSANLCIFCWQMIPLCENFAKQTNWDVDWQPCVCLSPHSSSVWTWCFPVCWESCPLARFVSVNPFLWLDAYSWLPIQSAGWIKNMTNSLKPRPLEAGMLLNWMTPNLAILTRSGAKI